MRKTIMVICSESEAGFWNNDLGWVYDVADAQRYVDGENGNDRKVPPLMVTKDAEWVTVAFED
jgi:hypothetical protein